MKKVKWLIEEREIPYIGLVNKNDIIEIPDNIAEEFISRGFVKEVKKPKKKEN